MTKGKEKKQSFQRRLLEAISWCQSRLRIDASDTFRTPALKPPFIGPKNDGSYSWNLSNYYDKEDLSVEVDELCMVRARALVRENVVIENVVHYYEKGRILEYNPFMSLDDGAACFASTGFFDYSNGPPWDTWLSYTPPSSLPGSLYSWVPTDFILLVEEGIYANPEACLRWSDDGVIEKIFEI